MSFSTRSIAALALPLIASLAAPAIARAGDDVITTPEAAALPDRQGRP